MRKAVGVVGVAVATAGLLMGSLSAQAAVYQTSTIDTFAGTGEQVFSGDGGPAVEAGINQPRDTDVMPDGSVVITDTFNDRIRRVSPDGIITTIAGNGSQEYNGDGIPATEASLAWPHDVAVDPKSGNVYIADAQHHRIRVVTPDGIISTFAGTGEIGSSGDDGPAVEATLKYPKSVAVRGNALITAGLDNKVRSINFDTRIISTLVGTGEAGFSGDGGPSRAAQLNGPQRLAVDSQRNVYIADTKNCAIRRFDTETGTVSTVAGVGGECGYDGDGGPGQQAKLSHPRGLALDGDDRLYIADSDNARIRMLNLSKNVIRTIGGGGQTGYAGEGVVVDQALFYQPRGLTITASGDLLVADTFNSRVRIVRSEW
ncbi:MAG: hypothetical protein ACK5MT_15930 [Actinomycetales bacterium]